MPRDLAKDSKLVSLLQQRLLRDDQTIKGKPGQLLSNADPADLARTATVAASGAIKDATPERILDGITRDIPKGPVHHWAGPLEQDGAWIELRWDRPQSLRQVQITFDSGFPRQLFLTASDSHTRTVVRAPQPETVRDYDVLVRRQGSTQWEAVAKVTGNFQRLRRHQFEASQVEALRLHAKATNGAEEARVFEIRCYA
jgi:hypothetical protein